MHAHVRLKDLDNSTCAFLKGQTFKHNVVAVWFLNIDERVLPSVGLENVGVNLLTNLTAEGSPVDCPAGECSILALLRL